MLILPIKKKWFDMILSGEKKEEYREIKPYYRSRLHNEGFLDQYGLPTLYQGRVLFRNGYAGNSPSFEAFCSLDIKTGHPEWGAESGREYYALKIIRIVEKRYFSNGDEIIENGDGYLFINGNCVAEPGTDEEFDRYFVEVQNGDGYYDSAGRFRSY